MYCEIVNKTTLVTTSHRYNTSHSYNFCDENYIYKAHILYPYIDRTLDCFHVLSIVNSALMYIGDEMQISL